MSSSQPNAAQASLADAGSQRQQQQQQQQAYYAQDGMGIDDDDDDFAEEEDLIPDFGQANGTGRARGEFDEGDEEFADGEQSGEWEEADQRAKGKVPLADRTSNALRPLPAALQEAQHQQQLQQAAAALAAVPEQIRKYIVLFNQAVQNNNVQDISNAYEGHWNRLTDKFYQRSEWPEAEVIAPLVNNDPKFLMLYRELWFRHVYSKLSPDGEDRFSSYDSYCDFFNYVLNSDGPVPLELPPQWLWDIVDEFIYQFQSYSQWRNKVSNKSEDELQLLQDGGVWSSYSVLNVLYSLIQKSRITEQLVAAQEGGDVEEAAGEFGSKPLYKMLGYFSIIGLLRVHVLLGDYTLALKMLDHIDLGKKSGLMNRVTACHVTAYYYVGFAYMMLGRYADAIKAFTHILIFTMRLRQYHTRSYQYDQINKTADRMYALLAICCALCPTKLDENIQNTMRDKYGEQFGRMSRGEEDLSAFEELFLYACPKYITSNSPPYHDAELLEAYTSNPTMGDPAQHQLKIFLSSVKTQLSNANIRSFLRLFTTLSTGKLASFLDIDEEELTEILMLLKSSTRSRMWNWSAASGNSGDSKDVEASGSNAALAGTSTQFQSLLDGSIINTSDLDFTIEGDMIHVAEARVGRRYAEWFKRNSVRMHDVLSNIQNKPLPIVIEGAAASGAAVVNGVEASQGDRRNNNNSTQRNGPSGGGKSAWGAASGPGAGAGATRSNAAAAAVAGN